MKRILFVDDEPRVLDGLRRMLRPQRREWYMLFVTGGEEALEKLASEPFDVVVSDMRMPGMDGAKLLGEVKNRHPDTVRIVLSGHTELESALRAIPIAHQFLSKPCEAETIKSAIERACSLNALLNYESVRRMVGKISELPAVPRIYSELMSILTDTEASAVDVANLVEQDMGISARILQTVNSGFFGLRREITSIPNAISYLGLNMVKHLVLGIELFQSYEGVGTFPGFTMADQQRHSLLVANLAMAMFKEAHLKDAAFTAGLMHDVGKMVLASELPDHFRKLAKTSAAERVSMHAVEIENSGVSHAEIGAYLLGLWGIPYPIVEAVAHHHQPSRVEQREFGALAALHVADVLAIEAVGNDGGDVVVPELDGELVESLDLAEKLAGWRKTAAEKVEKLKEGAM